MPAEPAPLRIACPSRDRRKPNAALPCDRFEVFGPAIEDHWLIGEELPPPVLSPQSRR